MPQKRTGFTIVELLIVIVVIGILAAITIVSYNGVVGKANEAKAKSELVNANQQILLAIAASGTDTAPTTLTAANATATTGGILQYSAGNPTTDAYCLTSSTGKASYYQNNTTQPSPIAGACPGHLNANGSNVTNLADDPNVNSLPSITLNGAVGGQFYSTAAPKYGTTFARFLWSAAGTSAPTVYESGINYDFGAGSATTSVWTRVTKAATMNLCSVGERAVGSSLPALTGTSACATTACTASTWCRLQVTNNTLTNDVEALRYAVSVSSTVSWAVNDAFDIDGVMISPGTTYYNFADGSSAGWQWAGAANASQSSGPAL